MWTSPFSWVRTETQQIGRNMFSATPPEAMHTHAHRCMKHTHMRHTHTHAHTHTRHDIHAPRKKTHDTILLDPWRPSKKRNTPEKTKSTCKENLAQAILFISSVMIFFEKKMQHHPKMKPWWTLSTANQKPQHKHPKQVWTYTTPTLQERALCQTSWRWSDPNTSNREALKRRHPRWKSHLLGQKTKD